MSSRSKKKKPAHRHVDQGPHPDLPHKAFLPGTELGVLIGATCYAHGSTADPKYCLDILDLDRGAAAPERIQIGFLAHGFAVHPKRPHEAALLEKQGPGGCYVDLVEKRVLLPILPLKGHAFYGHGAFSRSGDVLFAVETDLTTHDGYISVRDAVTFASLGTFPTYGKSPHDCRLIENGRTLAITNGGGAIDTPHLPSVTFVDVENRKLLDRCEVSNPRINTGHIALSDRFREFAVVSAPRSGLPADVNTGGVSLRAKGGPWVHMTAPKQITDRFLGESLSVCIHQPSRVVLATHPFGHLITFWNLTSQTLLAAMDMPNPRGCTVTLDGRYYAVAFGPTASLLLIDAETRRPVEGQDPGSLRFGGSHIYTWAYPA